MKIEKNTFVSTNKREEYWMDNKNQKANPKKELAGSFYHPSYYQETDDLSAGIAMAHEQASDAYTEGEIGAVIDDVNGEDIPIPQKGYDK
ncbi:YozQ family protein [Neobacillus drentensis]|uniref:YozQ family protein n=1 Tax=Neobacillus drentensis TaxID=220684 RepID=UPI00300008C6